MDLLPAADLAKRSRFVCFSTLDEASGFPETRLLFNLRSWRSEACEAGPARLENPFASWLGTNTSSRKIRHIRKDPRVCLHFADTESFEGLTVQGRVDEVFEPTIRAAIWTPDWDRYYPGGREGGDFTLLRFTPMQGHYYHNLSVLDFDASAMPA